MISKIDANDKNKVESLQKYLETKRIQEFQKPTLELKSFLINLTPNFDNLKVNPLNIHEEINKIKRKNKYFEETNLFKKKLKKLDFSCKNQVKIEVNDNEN